MKNPFFRWLVIQATTITPTTPAPASGVRRPTTSRAPEPISVRLASQAWRAPGFIPRLSNQRAVPGIFPPRKTWLIPWARKTTPRTTRSRSSERLTAVVEGIPSVCQGYQPPMDPKLPDGEAALHRLAAGLDSPMVIVTAVAPDGRRAGCLV